MSLILFSRHGILSIKSAVDLAGFVPHFQGSKDYGRSHQGVGLGNILLTPSGLKSGLHSNGGALLRLSSFVCLV